MKYEFTVIQENGSVRWENKGSIPADIAINMCLLSLLSICKQADLNNDQKVLLKQTMVSVTEVIMNDLF